MNFRRSLPEFRCQACLSPVRSQLKPLSCGIEPGDRGFSVKRFPFLDWMRGLAVLIMIQCHTFNSFTRSDLRDGGPDVRTQFIGGMAAPLVLLMAGMTTAFQMESLERRHAPDELGEHIRPA